LKWLIDISEQKNSSLRGKISSNVRDISGLNLALSFEADDEDNMSPIEKSELLVDGGVYILGPHVDKDLQFDVTNDGTALPRSEERILRKWRLQNSSFLTNQTKSVAISSYKQSDH
jgi:hypothetical protein